MNPFAEKVNINDLLDRYNKLILFLEIKGLTEKEFLEAANRRAILSVRISNYYKNNLK